MTQIIGAPTLDDALTALKERVGELEERGEKTLVFCEDRLTLLAERAVLERTGGTFLTEVTTFKRFLAGNRRVLSKEGSVMAIAGLINDCAGELKCFRRGSAQAVYETIAQLAASRVTAEMLISGADETGGMLALKLRDLALLLEKYTEFLAAHGYVDESGYLALLPEKIEGELKDANAVFFAFPSFTRQAAEGVRAAVLHAKSATGVFIAGREDFYTNEGAHIFRRVAEECGEVGTTMTKCSLTGDAELLRTSIFRPEKFGEPRVSAESIRVFSAGDEQEEMNTVAALVKKHISEGKRYRDLAVLVPSEEYFAVAEKTFIAYGIPYFLDRKRPFSEHPFCTFVLSVLNAVHDGVLPDEADDIASSVYFGDGDEYRNYLMKFGNYRGGAKREIREGDAVKGYDRDKLVLCHERMKGILSLFPTSGKGRAFTEGVRNLLAAVDGEKVTERLLSDATLTSAEREFLDIAPLENVLAEVEAVAGEHAFKAREFAVMLESGLKAHLVAMIPQYADALFVGDVTESRIRRADVLFCVGITDALPRVSTDTAVITDGDMKKLAALRVEIEPAIAQVNARARECLALNLCAFTEGLYLSCPVRLRGAEVTRGEALTYVEKLLKTSPMSNFFPYLCSETGPAILELLRLEGDFAEGRIYDRRAHATLRAVLREQEEERVKALLGGSEKENVAEAGELYFSGEVSPTLLEKYFACPYAGFVTRALRVREREERAVLDTDTGTFVHSVLQHVAEKLKSDEIKSEEECRKVAEEYGKTLLSTPKYVALTDTGVGRYTGDRLVREAQEVAAATWRQVKQSSFRISETEQSVAISSLALTGKADRVDQSDDLVRVVDYKTGYFDDKPTSYYTGQKLQLELYLQAVTEERKRKGEECRAAGVFYFPASDEFGEEGAARFMARGFYCADEDVVNRFDTNLATTGSTELFKCARTARGIDSGMTREDFDAFLDYSLLVSAGAEEEMKAGNIAPTPFEGACEHCKLLSMCAFTGNARRERTVNCKTIARIVRRARGEEE